MDPLIIRPSRSKDLPELLAIYNHFVDSSDATLDFQRATLAERRNWLSTYSIERRHQLWIAEMEGAVRGYVSSNPYRIHPAFSRTVEASVYLHPESRGRGVGGALYDTLLTNLHDHSDVHSVVAAVALPNDSSLALHRSRGFREVGTFTEYAVKNDRWISSTWFERLM